MRFGEDKNDVLGIGVSRVKVSPETDLHTATVPPWSQAQVYRGQPGTYPVMASWSSAFFLFFGGWIVFPGLFILQLNFWFKSNLGRRLTKQYDLSEKDCCDIANKLVSTFQAFLATTTGVVVCGHCYDDVLHKSHPLTLIYAWFGLPYFFYDTISMFYVSTLSDLKPKESYIKKIQRFVTRSPVIVIHHIVLAPVGFSLLLFFRDSVNNGDFFMGIVYLMEASTPFVCMRFILSKFRLKSSRWYAVNGLLMLILFPIFRIVSPFYTAYLYGEQQHMSTSNVLLQMPFGWKFAFFLAVAPQIYWYMLMWRGLVRMLAKEKAIESPKTFNEGITQSPSRPARLSGFNGAKEFAH